MNARDRGEYVSEFTPTNGNRRRRVNGATIECSTSSMMTSDGAAAPAARPAMPAGGRSCAVTTRNATRRSMSERRSGAGSVWRAAGEHLVAGDAS
jgi:hypothetical protein